MVINQCPLVVILVKMTQAPQPDGHTRTQEGQSETEQTAQGSLYRHSTNRTQVNQLSISTVIGRADWLWKVDWLTNQWQVWVIGWGCHGNQMAHLGHSLYTQNQSESLISADIESAECTLSEIAVSFFITFIPTIWFDLNTQLNTF